MRIGGHKVYDTGGYPKKGKRSYRDSPKLIDKTARLKTGKGAVGTTIEENLFGYTPNSESEPDFPEAGVELKATPYVRGKGGIPAI